MAETVKIKIETTGGEDIVNNLNKADDAAKSLKAQLREATLELQNMSDQPGIDPVKLQEAAQRVGELRDKIGEANENAAAFAGNKFENISNSLGGVKSALLNLDFEKASTMAKNFAVNAKSISFGGAISSVKDLGSTFMTIGKALLTNPIFLIAAVIAGIVLAIKVLLDKLGVTKVIMKAIGDVFKFVGDTIDKYLIQPLKDLADWFGVTNNAAEESAQKQSDALRKTADASKKKSEEVNQAIDTEIRIAELQGKSTEQLQRKKVQGLREVALEEYKANLAALKAATLKGEADEKELADLREKLRLSRIAYTQSKDNVKIFEEEITKKKSDELEKRNEDEAKSQKTSSDNAAAARKAAADKQREYDNQRLNAERQYEDLRLLLMKDGVEKELLENDLKYGRLIEDTKNNEKLLQTERKNIIDTYQKLQSQASIDIINKSEKEQADAKLAAQKETEDKMKAEEDKAWSDEKERMDLKTSYILDAEEKSRSERLNAYQQELVDLQASLDSGLITRAEYDELTKNAEKKKNDDLSNINKEYRDKEEAAEKDLRDKKIQAVQSTLSTIGNLAELFAGKSLKSQERAFKVQKAANIANATIDTYKAATAAYSSLAGIPTVGPALGVAAAAAAVAAGLVNIKKIASTKFNPSGGGEGGDSGASPAPSGGETSTANNLVAPIPAGITLNGSANAGSTGGGTQLYGSRQTPIRSYVVESDITNTQNTLQMYQQRSEIG